MALFRKADPKKAIIDALKKKKEQAAAVVGFFRRPFKIKRKGRKDKDHEVREQNGRIVICSIRCPDPSALADELERLARQTDDPVRARQLQKHAAELRDAINSKDSARIGDAVKKTADEFPDDVGDFLDLPPAPRGGRQTALSGRSAEEAVSEATGIPLNRGAGRQTVPGTGPGGFRIPDLQVFGPNASLAVRGSIIEVKNVTRLSGTRQIRDLAEQARRLGGRLEIFTNAPAPSRGELRKLIDARRVVLRPLP